MRDVVLSPEGVKVWEEAMSPDSPVGKPIGFKRRKISLHSKPMAYWRGYYAYDPTNWPLCPYPPSSNQALWLQGWKDAEEEGKCHESR